VQLLHYYYCMYIVEMCANLKIYRRNVTCQRWWRIRTELPPIQESEFHWRLAFVFSFYFSPVNFLSCVPLLSLSFFFNFFSLFLCVAIFIPRKHAQIRWKWWMCTSKQDRTFKYRSRGNGEGCSDARVQPNLISPVSSFFAFSSSSSSSSFSSSSSSSSSSYFFFFLSSSPPSP